MIYASMSVLCFGAIMALLQACSLSRRTECVTTTVCFLILAGLLFGAELVLVAATTIAS